MTALHESGERLAQLRARAARWKRRRNLARSRLREATQALREYEELCRQHGIKFTMQPGEGDDVHGQKERSK